ncbi:MAG: FAD-binding and (Fe-S)-binding domain-containing protein [Bacteroidales bacterium]|jgi:D-lactate dehydrogenase|nr:FAD-binding and (Fe-S)-binding domain-containing protein [Bacteroidales bacterium]
MITGKYREFYETLSKEIPKERLLHDSLSTLAFGTDASFYRLIPKLVVKVVNESELISTIKIASQFGIPLTFRAAGTSLSGQAITDSVLVVATHGWQDSTVLDNGAKIRLQSGIRGQHANNKLNRYGRKIGPDPASIDAAMIGGIAANNASGMCCGTAENSYKTIADIRVVLHDGTILDTSDKTSRENFKHSHKELIEGIESLAKEIKENKELNDRIVKKFKIKNTTGYSLNALTDYTDGIEIIKHLMIGSEGTLGFISDITYNTVVDHKYKALALNIYPSIELACKAVQILKKQPVYAAEIMDRAAVRSVQSTKGVPEYIKNISAKAAALLVETRAETEEQLNKNVSLIIESISSIETELPIIFTTDSKLQASLWKIRKETLPTVAAMRELGTTPIIEDICFPIEKLAEGTLKLQSLFEKYKYEDAVIFGHSLEGNLHFMFNPDFSKQEDIDKYSAFMDDVADLVVNGYDGSLKAEHGTGRNMAPYVEMEWGAEAYSMMKKIKKLFDPKEILNPGVILNDDKKIHLKNFKPLPPSKEVVDKCMECGFCEGGCVSEGFTLSPRQRIAVYREICRLEKSGEQPHIAAELSKLYSYAGLDTCATDGLCALKCPVKIDTGKLVKELRHEGHSKRAEKIAASLATGMGGVTKGMRIGLNTLYYLRLITGKKLFGAVATGMHKATGGLIPLWNEYFPKGAAKIDSTNKSTTDNKLKVVYFPSCITRSMGVSREYSDAMEITKVTEILIRRAGFEVIYPDGLDSLCCGMAFSSKGFVEAGKISSDKLEEALRVASEDGKYPVLCDMSPCLYTMKTNFGDRLKLYEPAEFADIFLLDKLNIKKLDKKVSLFAVCSAKKMEVDGHLKKIAELCTNNVVVIDSNCCGFAGDRGFLLPELNKHGLRNIKEQSNGCSEGYATSRTCEIGLSKHSGISFKSIFYLLEEATRD